MILNLVSGASAYFADPTTPKQHLGRLISPRTWNALAPIVASGMTWAADNDCYTYLRRDAYLAMLRRLAVVDHTNLRFVVVPDVVGDARRTLARFRLWQPVLRYYNLPAAFVAQDGLETMTDHVPWAQFEALFIGGSTAWKISPFVSRLAGEAKQRGKWLHLGRVNSARRITYAIALGCDSFDGTGYSRFSRRCIPLSIHIIQRIEAQATLWERTAP